MDVEDGSETSVVAGRPGAVGGSLESPLAAAVFDTMPVGAALWTADARLRHANPVLCGLLGTELAELRGTALVDLVTDADADDVARAVEDLQRGQRNAFECRLADGSEGSRITWPLRAHVAAAYGRDRRLAGMVLQVFDFAPAEGVTLPAGLATVLEEGSDFLLTTEPDGTLTYRNRAAREGCGADQTEDDAQVTGVLGVIL